MACPGKWTHGRKNRRSLFAGGLILTHTQLFGWITATFRDPGASEAIIGLAGGLQHHALLAFAAFKFKFHQASAKLLA